MSATLLDILEAGAPAHPALVVPGGLRLSYADLRREVEQAATRLLDLGVRPGDRVALVFPNSAEAVVLFLAATAVGSAAPLNPAYKEEEFRFYLDDIGATALLVPPSGAGAAVAAAADRRIVIEASFDLEGHLDLESAAAEREGPGLPATDGDDVALVLHTSGTTSRPKLVPLRHRNLVASTRNIVSTYDLGPVDVTLCVMPLFHVHGLVASALSTLASGGTVVIPRRFSAFEFWGLVEEHPITWYSAVPTMHQLLVGRSQRRPGQANPRTLRFIRSCSSALPPDLMHQLEGRFNVPLLDAYGMTEAAHQMASNPLPPAERLPRSVGKPTGVGMAILDEAGNELSAGLAGEVAVRGPNVMDGYESNPSANAEAFTRGWFRTGDLGFLDAKGYLTLVGRIKELINRGGEKIAPGEVDEVLLQHPAVAEAVAFGVPHPGWGEEVAAAVVLASQVGEKELIAFCRERLADFKVPRRIHILEEIPRTATGKVQRRNVAASLGDS
ncbi:MAG TPA: acyl--CoA ligase [Candidatus Dormibacteraeota bacterium]